LSRVERLKCLVKAQLEEKTPPKVKRRVKVLAEIVKGKEPALRREFEVRKRRGREHLKRLVERHIVNPVKGEVKRSIHGSKRRRRTRRYRRR